MEYDLLKLRQGNYDFISYYTKFQDLVTHLQYNNAIKRAAPHHSLHEELKDILSTQDLPKDWS
jgi:hypothetical protein